MKKILVTGAKGFLGRNIVKNLKDDNDVTGCGRTMPEDTDIYRYVHWNICDGYEPVKLLGEDFDVIIHAAASLDKNNLSEELIKTNIEGTFNVMRFAIEHSVKTVIYISGLPIIGDTHQVPITENIAINPGTLYHATKAAGESIINQCRHYGIRVVVLRVPSPIGPDMPNNTIVPILIQHALKGEDIQIWGKGTRKQNYLDIRDCANAIKLILENELVDGVYNIGAKNIVSNYELATTIIKLLKSNSRITLSGEDSSDLVDWTTDDSKLRKLIGEYQQFSISQSISDIANEMKKA